MKINPLDLIPLFGLCLVGCQQSTTPPTAALTAIKSRQCSDPKEDNRVEDRRNFPAYHSLHPKDVWVIFET
jgi:hypothetical protein